MNTDKEKGYTGIAEPKAGSVDYIVQNTTPRTKIKTERMELEKVH